MTVRHWLYAVSAILILGALGASSSVSGFEKRTAYLTFSAPVGLPGVTLGPGTYTFELAAPDRDLDLVRVTSRDGRLVYFTGFTKTVERPWSLPLNQMIVLGESPANTAPPIKAWYSPDQRTGHQFIY
jgi:hypothetical protein